MHILIIEDEEQLCRSVAEGLRIDGYETDICFDGDEGLCLCMTENYDLILLDLNLPGTDGLEILRQFLRLFFLPLDISAVQKKSPQLCIAPALESLHSRRNIRRRMDCHILPGGEDIHRVRIAAAHGHGKAAADHIPQHVVE